MSADDSKRQYRRDLLFAGMFGASWAPAISFAMLLAVLAIRPQGLLGR